MTQALRSIASARQHLQSGDVSLAEREYTAAIADDPENIEAWEFLIRRRIMAKETLAAIALLGKTPEPIRPHPNIQLLAGLALQSIGDLANAEKALRSAADAILVARLHLASVLEAMGRQHEALVHYFGAINQLQQQGACRDEGSTPPALRGLVLHAMQQINDGRRTLFQSLLEPHVIRYGQSELKRVADALAIYLGERAPDYPDPRQRPSFLYIPGLPAITFHPVDQYPWVQRLQQDSRAIRDELLGLMNDGKGMEAVHAMTGDALKPYVQSTEGGNWKGAFFYRHGIRYDDNASRCPLTFKAIESLPLARVKDHGPEVLFSVLDPGTEILSHRGVTNSRLVVHLPLIVPPDCALDVSGELHHWQEGRCMMFDDTYEHRAWNRSRSVRVVLIADVWNPHLSEPERAAIADLVAGVGEFNRACGI